MDAPSYPVAFVWEEVQLCTERNNKKHATEATLLQSAASTAVAAFGKDGGKAMFKQLRFIADNPTGDNIDYYFPNVTLSPNGDYALKSDEWQVVPFTVDILKSEGMEALYADSRPVTA